MAKTWAVKAFVFILRNTGDTYELPPHWEPIQIEIVDGKVWVWAKRNGS